MSEWVVQLFSGFVGGLIGFGSAYGLWKIEQRGRDLAVRSQILGLLRAAESVMLGIHAHGVPLDRQWSAIDLLAERAFSSDGATAFSGIGVGGRNAFDLISEILQGKATLEYLIGQMIPLGEAMRSGDYGQTGPPRMEALKRNLQARSLAAAQTLRELRAAVGDRTSVSDPVPQNLPDVSTNRV